MARANQARRSSRHPAQRLRASATWATQWAVYARWAGPVVIGLSFFVMMCWTWESWADVIVDFGRELYIPWRLVEGEVLYRDLAHFNGPLSPYVNSVWFRMFGTSLRVLSLANLAILGLTLSLLYSLLSSIGSRTAAFLASMLFVLVFAFSALGYNLNYVCPYSHEMTHGLLLSLLAVVFVGRFARAGSIADAGLCGLCVGAAFLTKPEIFVAVLPAVVAGLAMVLWLQGLSVRRGSMVAGAFVAGGLAPPLISVCLLSLAMPPSEALAGTLGAFRWVFSSEITSQPFYRRLRGTYEWQLTAQRFIPIALGYVVFIGLPALLGLLLRKRPKWWLPGAVLIFVIAVGVLARFQPRIPWGYAFLPLPVVILIAWAVLIGRWRRSRTIAERQGLVVPVTFAIFSLLLMAKVFFSVRPDNYGFVLAVPALFLSVAVLWDWLPRAIDARGGASIFMRAGLLAALIMASAGFLDAQKISLGTRTVRVGTGGDAIWWNSRGHEVNRALRRIETELPPDGTFAVAPEGIMLNYLTRRRNPTHYISYMPLEMLLFGEDQMIAGFAQDPPAAVLVVTRDLKFYDLQPFGAGYAQKLGDWLLAHYQTIDTGPSESGMFQIAILMPRDAAGAPPASGDQNAPGP